jgi:hypothetical protein
MGPSESEDCPSGFASTETFVHVVNNEMELMGVRRSLVDSDVTSRYLLILLRPMNANKGQHDKSPVWDLTILHASG